MTHTELIRIKAESLLDNWRDTMKKALFALCAVALLGCSEVIIEDGDGADDTSTTDTSASSGSVGSTSSTSVTTSVSSSSSSSSGVGGAGGGCERELTIEQVSHTTAQIPDGTSGNEILHLKLTASDCGDIDVNNAGFQLVSLDDDPADSTPFCDAPCASPEDWNFRNLKIKDANGATYMGPMEFHAAAQNQPARADFNDSFTVTSGTSIELTFTLDIAPPHLNVDGRRYKLFLLGMGTEGDVIQTNVNNVPADDAFTVFDFDAKLVIALNPLTPTSHVIVAGKDAWVNFATYNIMNFTDDPQTIDTAEIAQGDPNGDVADFSSVALAMDGATKLTGNQVIVAGSEKHFYIDDPAPGQNFTIPAKTTKIVQVWGKLQNVQSSASVNGAWHGVARSGHTPSLRIENVHVTSDPSIFGQAPATVVNPPSMSIRESKPVVTKQTLSSTTLTNIDQDLAKVQVSADSAGGVDMKKLAFSVSMTQGLMLSNFRVRRGATDLDLSTYDVFVLCSDSPCTNIVQVNVVFDNAESIVGSGQVYTLHATVSGVTVGSSITLSFIQATGGAAPVTGKLTWFGGGSMGPYLVPGNWQPPNGNVPADYSAGMFLWSDQSEVPHSESSVDWTNDLWLDIAPMSWTLSL